MAVRCIAGLMPLGTMYKLGLFSLVGGKYGKSFPSS